MPEKGNCLARKYLRSLVASLGTNAFVTQKLTVDIRLFNMSLV